nr:autotransporter outer membrane beta-barrel domain-containing protein [Polynucleobacter sp. Tro8-14-1]
MAFGISALSTKGSGVLGNYSTVLNGITSANLGYGSATTSGTQTSNGYTYTLNETASGSNIWDLSLLSAPPLPVTGPSTVNTQASLTNTVQPLQGTVTVLNTTLANSFSYDCTEFGANNICVSAGGRNTAVSAANGLNNTSALLIAAYRPHPNYRIGAYADQNLSVNNAGSTVNLGNNTPLVGLFGAWNQRLGGTGAEVKVSAAYGQKNATVTRSVVGTGATASEAGNGSAPINSQGAQVTAKYGFGIVENVIVSPYVGVRYTQNNMNGYTEAASSTVTAPLTYSALNTNATTALAGVGAQYKFIPQATAFASVGVETDTNTSNGTYSATGITGLTPINFNANPVKTRPTAMLGASYDVEKNQRLGITGIYRQEPYQAVQTTTVMATYTVGF